MRKLATAMMLLSVVVMSGCTVFVPPPPQMSSARIPNSEPVGSVEGESSAFYLFGLIRFGNAALNQAIKDALSKRGGDALTNVAIDHGETSYWVFGHRTRTRVFGVAVRYKK